MSLLGCSASRIRAEPAVARSGPFVDLFIELIYSRVRSSAVCTKPAKTSMIVRSGTR
jgi:hypothetical protein